jgi:co-chaperonin GroES (HSP10)
MKIKPIRDNIIVALEKSSLSKSSKVADKIIGKIVDHGPGINGNRLSVGKNQKILLERKSYHIFDDDNLIFIKEHEILGVIEDD